MQLKRYKTLMELFLVFFRIGLFTFGGGYAMISLIEHEIGQRRKWVDMDELAEVFAIAESTPGPIAVNCATYVGNHRAGTPGGIVATLGVVLPSFIIIYLISLFFERFTALNIVVNAFKGIQVAVSFLIARAGFRMLKRMPKSAVEISACLIAMALVGAINLLHWHFSTIWIILFGAAVGLFLRRVPEKQGGNR